MGPDVKPKYASGGGTRDVDRLPEPSMLPKVPKGAARRLGVIWKQWVAQGGQLVKAGWTHLSKISDFNPRKRALTGVPASLKRSSCQSDSSQLVPFSVKTPLFS